MKTNQLESHCQNYFILILFIVILGLVFTTSAEINYNKFKYHHSKVNILKIHKKPIQNINKKELSDQYRRTLPPNIWTLLAENSISYNQQNSSTDEVISSEIFIKNSNNSQNDELLKMGPLKCPKCSKNSVKMSEDELTSLRIEYVKNQILHKLRMDERPPKKSFDDLPEPIQEGFAIQNDDDTDYLNRQLDDYFAKTTQKIIFLTQDFEKCKSHEYPCICFMLNISEDLDVNIIESAELWIYLEPNNLNRRMNHTFLLSEVELLGTSKKTIKSKTLAISQFGQDGLASWEKIDLTSSLKLWLEQQNLNPSIQVACESCKTESIPISQHQDHKPFIVINTFPKRTLNRQRRNVNCGLSSTECCRDSLYIDFATIGWNDWIIHPKGYNAYFCRGSCNRVASITQAGTHHSTIFNKFLHHSSKNSQKKLELVPCCTATRYSSLQIFYLDSNNTATQVTLPNMIVESCGCS
ncbi:unnamed protein product [Chironomus riparius]|uniref:TGF-beta family profile domain-containing protein n=1 Tax=Chironomus riparius TaxID=315576 RepID=A0A9N9RJG3_9DIPT|nr:unnamed protein product [Chironomus riparius]